MRFYLGLIALTLAVGLLCAEPTSAQGTAQQSKTVTQGSGFQGNSSSWMTGLTLSPFRLQDLFSPFQTIGTPGYTTSTMVNPNTHPKLYLQQFGYSRPVRR